MTEHSSKTIFKISENKATGISHFRGDVLELLEYHHGAAHSASKEILSRYYLRVMIYSIMLQMIYTIPEAGCMFLTRASFSFTQTKRFDHPGPSSIPSYSNFCTTKLVCSALMEYTIPCNSLFLFFFIFY